MSQAKFAPVTSSLLARKGEAGPWSPDARKLPLAWEANGFKGEAKIEAPPAPVLPPVSFTPAPTPPRAATAASQSGDPDRIRSCTLKLSARDYERLAIVAVKRGSTPRQMMLLAIEEFLSSVAREYRAECGCLATGGCSQPECRSR